MFEVCTYRHNGRRCSRSAGHYGGHDPRSARWHRVRFIVRAVVITALATAFFIVGSMDSPMLH